MSESCECRACVEQDETTCSPDSPCDECPGCEERKQDAREREFEERRAFGWL